MGALNIAMDLSQYTEDDTARVLSRPDIHEMEKLYRDFCFSINYGKYNSLDNITFAKSYKWCWLEFLIARKKEGYVWP